MTAPCTFSLLMLRASCLMLEIKEFRCYEAKIKESEKANSHTPSGCHVCDCGIQYHLCACAVRIEAGSRPVAIAQ